MITIVKEPTAGVYKALLRFSLVYCSAFSLVWRKQFRFAPSAHEVAQRLRPDIISNELLTEWPGTRLIGHAAIVRKYRLNEETVSELAKVHGLYSWREPALPEDLVLYANHTRPWLVTISHEHDSWIEDGTASIDELRIAVPGIVATEEG